MARERPLPGLRVRELRVRVRVRVRVSSLPFGDIDAVPSRDFPKIKREVLVRDNPSSAPVTRSDGNPTGNSSEPPFVSGNFPARIFSGVVDLIPPG